MKNSISTTQVKLFNMTIIWSMITSLFTWLPLVRIIGRPSEYYWGVFNMSGEGIDGPFWIFVIGATYVVLLFYAAFRVKLRKYTYVMIIFWNVFVLFLILYGVLLSKDNTVQGQGLHWEFPIWILIIPALLFTAFAVLWVIKESRNGIHFAITSWKMQNSVKLLISLTLLVLAIFLFSMGDNYNWITSIAIICTVVHWIILVESFKPIAPKH